ncbi:MAG TPA: hypothetical protein ENI96_08910 [Sedimenticola thiotaurini]|uniref:Uncharacterized protein n=1 Tax=Sedimenticola thiotaurini TaxID=1543721 RepID=A0A831RPX9_9GAMM|nr:hypothetical protein [Sedimenticola thiotaurini]
MIGRTSQTVILRSYSIGGDTYSCLVDVLQRVALHPARDVGELTSRIWKERFAGNPLRSDLEYVH